MYSPRRVVVRSVKRPLASLYAVMLLSSSGLDELSSSLGLTSDASDAVLAVLRRWRIRDARYSMD